MSLKDTTSSRDDVVKADLYHEDDAQPVVVPPDPNAPREPRVVAAPESATSEPKDSYGKRMRHGAGIPVPFPVADRKVFDSLKRAVSALGSSLATALRLAPLRAVDLRDLIATQTTVDPKVVERFVRHPDLARTSPLRMHRDGRPLDSPFVVEVEGLDSASVSYPTTGPFGAFSYDAKAGPLQPLRFIFDGHHRLTADVQRGETRSYVRLLKVKRIEQVAAKAASASVRAKVLDSKGEPPEEFLIFPYGDVDTSKGCFVFDEKSAKSVLAFYEEQGNALSIDYEHMAVCEPPVVAPAAGFFKLELRKSGLWAVEVEWTERAGRMLKDREYRYFSPAFTIDKESKRIVKLLNVALTNIPATKSMTALVEARMVDSAIVLCRHGLLPKRATEPLQVLARAVRRRLVVASERAPRGVKKADYAKLSEAAKAATKLARSEGSYKSHLNALRAQLRAASAADGAVAGDHKAVAEQHRSEALKLAARRSAASKLRQDFGPGLLAEAATELAERVGKNLTVEVTTRMTAKRRYTRGVVNGLAKGGFQIQSLIFPKEHWSKASAKRWAKDHDFAPGLDETDKSFRFRQRDPGEFDSLATICLTPGSAKAGSRQCKIKAVGGPLKKKAKVSTEEVAAEPIEASAKLTAEKAGETIMARRKANATNTKGSKAGTVAASAPKAGKEEGKIRASNTPGPTLYGKDGQPIDVTEESTQAAVQTGVRKGKSEEATRRVAAKGDEDSGDSDSGVDSGDSDSDEDMEAAGDSGDSADSDDSDSDSDSDSDMDDDSDGEVEGEMSAGAADSGDSGDSDSDSGDSDSGEEEPAAKATPTNPETEQATSQRSKRGSVAAVVAKVTGSSSKKDQIAKLHALAEAGEQIATLSAKVERMEKRDRKLKITRIVDKAIKRMRLPPGKRSKTIALGLEHGETVLAKFIEALPKRIASSERHAEREPDTSKKLVVTSLTPQEKEIAARMGVSVDDFVQTRMARAVKERTGQGRGQQ